MPDTTKPGSAITREKLVDLLNEDLEREYQAIIAYVNYSQVLKGAAYMNIVPARRRAPVPSKHRSAP